MVATLGVTFIYFNFSDTPAWLLVKGREKESIQAALNSVQLFTGNQGQIPKLTASKSDEKEKEPVAERGPSLLTTVNYVLTYFCITLVFFGKTLALRKIPGNLHIIAAFDGICGILGHLSSLCLSHLPPRSLHLLAILISGCGCLLVQYMGDSS